MCWRAALLRILMLSTRGAGKWARSSTGSRPRIWCRIRTDRARIRAKLGSRIGPGSQLPAPSHRTAPAPPVIVQIRARGADSGHTAGPPDSRRQRSETTGSDARMRQRRERGIRWGRRQRLRSRRTSTSIRQRRQRRRRSRSWRRSDDLPMPLMAAVDRNDADAVKRGFAGARCEGGEDEAEGQIRAFHLQLPLEGSRFTSLLATQASAGGWHGPPWAPATPARSSRPHRRQPGAHPRRGGRPSPAVQPHSPTRPLEVRRRPPGAGPRRTRGGPRSRGGP